MKKEAIKVIISGGGTGGHIFPAIAIANALREKLGDNADILFVGAQGKMEMEQVPAAGYAIKGLKIVGIQRSFSLKNIVKNLVFPFKWIRSLNDAKKIIRAFNPDVVVGVGGYASAPTLRCASNRHIPCLIQEQNSYPGVTNKMLAKKAAKICVAYSGMERFFPKEKIVLTGNPVRAHIAEIDGKRLQAFDFFALQHNKKTLLVVGGSLGAWSVNEAIEAGLETLINSKLQIIWQTGTPFFERARAIAQHISNVKALPFIKEMDLAYAAADIIVSRAGAIAISELCLVGKPVIFVPYPYASENHQLKNAMTLKKEHAAYVVLDVEARKKLIETTLALANDDAEMGKLASNIQKLAVRDADKKIAAEIIKLSEKK